MDLILLQFLLLVVDVLIKQEGDFYIATANKVGSKATISVSAKTPEGKSVSLASEEFRVFPLPVPSPQFGGKGIESATISAAIAKKGPPIVADMSGAPLDIAYKVTGFQMLVSNNGKVVIL